MKEHETFHFYKARFTVCVFVLSDDFCNNTHRFYSSLFSIGFYDCHEHTESNIIAKHNEEGIYNISNCTSCHKSGNEHDIKENNKSERENEND